MPCAPLSFKCLLVDSKMQMWTQSMPTRTMAHFTFTTMYHRISQSVYLMLALSSHSFQESGRPVNVPFLVSKPTWQSWVTLVGPEISIADWRSSRSSETRFLPLENHGIFDMLHVYLATQTTDKWCEHRGRVCARNCMPHLNLNLKMSVKDLVDELQTNKHLLGLWQPKTALKQPLKT